LSKGDYDRRQGTQGELSCGYSFRSFFVLALLPRVYVAFKDIVISNRATVMSVQGWGNGWCVLEPIWDPDPRCSVALPANLYGSIRRLNNNYLSERGYPLPVKVLRSLALVIFENYDDPCLPGIWLSTGYDIRSYIPTRSQGSIIITSRSSRLTFSQTIETSETGRCQHERGNLVTMIRANTVTRSERKRDAYVLVLFTDFFVMATHRSQPGILIAFPSSLRSPGPICDEGVFPAASASDCTPLRFGIPS
jgi:hypothetical protein